MSACEYNKYHFYFEFILFDNLSKNDFQVYEFYKAFKTDEEARNYYNDFLKSGKQLNLYNDIYDASVYNVTENYEVYGI